MATRWGNRTEIRILSLDLQRELYSLKTGGLEKILPTERGNKEPSLSPAEL